MCARTGAPRRCATRRRVISSTARRRAAFCISSIPARPRSTARASTRATASRSSSRSGKRATREGQACYDATTWHPSITEYFPGGGWSSKFLTARRDVGDDVPDQPGQGPRPRAADRRRLDGRPARQRPRDPRRAHQPDVADHLVRAEAHRRRRVPRRVQRDEPLGGPTTARSATATSGRISSPWPRCFASPSTCTTSPRKRSSARAPGLRSARMTPKARTTAPAPTLARYTPDLHDHAIPRRNRKVSAGPLPRTRRGGAPPGDPR